FLSVWMLAFFTKNYRSDSIEAITVNDIVRTARENWDSLSALEPFAAQTDLLVFGSTGFKIYSCGNRGLLNGITSPEQAVSEGCLCLPVAKERTFLGTLVIPDPNRGQYDKTRFRLIVCALLFCIAASAVMLFFVLYSYRSIVRPFKKLKDFAEHVARGDLEQPLDIEKDNLFGAFTVSFDIMREELKAASSREHALRLKEKELIASLSHDLKTPVSGIQIVCELLLVKLKDAYTIGKIQEIHRKSLQINALVSDLLVSSLDDLGEMQVTCSDEYAAVLHEIVAGHDPRRLVREDSIPDCMICIDSSRLAQAIGNIISNSYKYAGTEIDVHYAVSDGYLKMSLRDHGPGIPAEELPLVTNKFYRGKTVRHTAAEGSGLGLYIASELLSRMNGELICSSKEGEGLTVTLLLPLS
ncbi:MAG: HAMP domain-containing histidine kinase, partial [Oscillospiraceae bacterium]|nr:HAMP domain-containing histidine kinase [Oscillospiraceae bacterium]